MTNFKVNDKYTVEITGMTHEGQGVGRIEGFTVFVDRAIPGEIADIRLTTVKKSYAVGEILKIVKASSSRTQPFCSAFSRCGGCSLQHMTYEAQLEFKRNTVRDNLQRIGKLENVVIHDTIGMQNPLRYRNKAQYPVSVIDGKAAAGFYENRTHEIVACDTCSIQDEMSDRVKAAVSKFINDNKISVYDEKSGRGLIRHIMTRTAYKTGEVMVVLVVNGNELPRSGALVEKLTSDVPKVKSIILNINTRNSNIILGDKNIKLFGSDTITDYIGKFRFLISPLSFFQVNPVQTEALYGKALEYAALTGSETVFDLYCGIGTISLFLSEKARKVYGVEVVEDAILDARKNAEMNNASNVEFIAGEAEKVIPEMYRQGARADVVVVDPPRKGCDEALLETLVSMKPVRIVYVSCNPSTLARDLNYLDAHGYKTIEVQPVDMFPQTAHVETVTLLYRRL